jgi:Amt family ammonium transporter
VFAEHGVAGILGLLANALFGADYIIGLDGVNTGIIPGGWLNKHWSQMYIQIAYIVAATAYAFIMSAIIAVAINYTPGLHLRASEEAELLGMDDDQLGEFAYDYVEVRRDYLAWTPAKDEPMSGEHNIPMHERHGISEHTDMIEGKSPHGSQSQEEPADGSADSAEGQHGHSAIIGDRHGVAAEDEKKAHLS